MRRSDAVMARPVEAELILLDVASGTYFALNEVGAFVWNELAEERTRGELVAAVVDAYDVDQDEADRDVGELLQRLRDDGLIAS